MEFVADLLESTSSRLQDLQEFARNQLKSASNPPQASTKCAQLRHENRFISISSFDFQTSA
jgi:hypothetical protein